MKNVYRITIVLALITALAMNMLTVTSAAAAKEKTIKVNKSTYEKLKKENKELKKVKKENKRLKKEIKRATKTIGSLDATCSELEDQKSINQWMWSNIYSMGISYKNKTWTIPKEMPSTFYVNGTKYTVNQER